MRLRKVVNRPIRVDDDGVSVEGSVNAVVAANIDEAGSSRTSVSTKQRIVQRSARRSPTTAKKKKGAS